MPPPRRLQTGPCHCTHAHHSNSLTGHYIKFTNQCINHKVAVERRGQACIIYGEPPDYLWIILLTHLKMKSDGWLLVLPLLVVLTAVSVKTVY